MNEAVKRLRTEVATMVNQAKTLYADLEQKGDAVTADERAQLNTLIEAGTKKRAELEKLEELDANDRFTNAPVDAPKTQEPSVRQQWKTWGQTVIASQEFKAASARPGDGKMDRAGVPGGIKAVYSTLGTAGGVVVRNDFEPEILDIVRQRPPSVIDLVGVTETQSDAIDYIEQDTRVNNAAVVPEYSAGNFGLKPESNITFVERTAAVKWVATWIAVSKQILMDAPRLRDTVDNELLYMVRFALENQVLTGDGTGNNFTGILNWSGIQTRTMHATTPVGRAQTTADTRMTTIRRAITDIRLEFYEATGIVLNPSDSENLEITEYNANRYAGAFDPVTMRVWRVPVVETTAITALTALVGNFRAAKLWDRMQADILVGQPNDFFLRNAVALLAELRAAFAVQRPKAFEKVTLI